MNSTESLNFFLIATSKIAMFFMFLPVLIGIMRFKVLSNALKIFFIYSCINIAISILLQLIVWLLQNYGYYFNPIFKKYSITNFSFISILAHLNNFGVLGWYFYISFTNQKIGKIIRYLSVFFILSSVINYLFIEGFRQPNIYNSTLSATFCFILPLIQLWYLFVTDSKVQLGKNSYYWICIGLITPNLIGFFLNFAGKKIQTTDVILYLQLNIIHDFLHIIGYILISIGFYYARYTKYMPKATT